MCIGLVVSRFPKFTETFVISEIRALERLGWRIEIYPLLRPEPKPHQAGVDDLVLRAHFGALFDAAAWRACWRQFKTHPRTVADLVVLLVRDAWRRPQFLLKNLALIPRICSITEHMRHAGVQHVHAHFATQAGFAAWALGRLTGLPYSIVAHGSDVHRHQTMLGRKVAESAFVATVSNFNRDVILAVCAHGSHHKVVVVRAGIDVESLEFRQPDVVFADRPPLIMCVGTLHEVKGQRHLIDAVALLAGRQIEVAVELIGDGEDRATLEILVDKLGIADRVQITGAIDHVEVLRRFRNASVVVVPSVHSSDGRKEGIPTVVLEAMAVGVPVVASDLAGIGEVVHHEVTGLLVGPGDAAGIADGIERLLADPQLARLMVERARTVVDSEFDLSVTARQMAGMIASTVHLPR